LLSKSTSSIICFTWVSVDNTIACTSHTDIKKLSPPVLTLVAIADDSFNDHRAELAIVFGMSGVQRFAVFLGLLEKGKASIAHRTSPFESINPLMPSMQRSLQ